MISKVFKELNWAFSRWPILTAGYLILYQAAGLLLYMEGQYMLLPIWLYFGVVQYCSVVHMHELERENLYLNLKI